MFLGERFFFSLFAANEGVEESGAADASVFLFLAFFFVGSSPGSLVSGSTAEASAVTLDCLVLRCRDGPDSPTISGATEVASAMMKGVRWSGLCLGL